MSFRAASALLLLGLASGCSGPAAPERVVIVTFDTTRADSFGCYGSPKGLTPNVDRFAEEAVVFENPVSAVPTTLPSHSTMFTGLYPHDHGVRYNIVFRLGEEADTLAESMRDAGYATAAFPASFILAKRFGLDQGFETYQEPPRPKKGQADSESVMRSASDGVDLVLDWLAEREGEKSFAWLHFYDPHAPYTPPFPYSSQYRDRPYDGEMAYTDAQFGRLLDALRNDPTWERTLLIVAGDHGEGMHDHRERQHSYLVYQSTQHVPLIVRAPGGAAGRVAEPVHLADITPTVLELAGLDAPGPMRGVSLAPALAGDSLPRRDLYFESVAGALNYGWEELLGVRNGRFKLIDSSDPELFDVETDPGELTNLASLEPERLQELRNALAQLEEPLGSTAAVEAQDPVMDPETEAFLASLGYVGGGSGSSAEDAPHPRELIDLEQEMMIARRAIAAEQWELVDEYARYVLRRDPSSKWGLKSLAMALLGQNRAREAQDFAAELLRLYPENDNGYAVLAQAYQAQGQTATAYDVLNQGRSKNPKSERLAYLSAVAAYESGRDTACTEDLEPLLEHFPRSSRILVMRSRCEARSGDAAAALATLGQAVEAGFREIDLVTASDEFAAVVQLPGFAELQAEIESRKNESAPSSDGES